MCNMTQLNSRINSKFQYYKSLLTQASFQKLMGAVNAREAFPSERHSSHEQDAEIPLDNIKAKVVSVSVDGLLRTKDDIVVESVKNLFKVPLTRGIQNKLP